jgi:hypothetical protein
MHLANHNIMWNSRKGAAFGFAQIAQQATEQLAPFLPSLIPKLYRYGVMSEHLTPGTSSIPIAAYMTA